MHSIIGNGDYTYTYTDYTDTESYKEDEKLWKETDWGFITCKARIHELYVTQYDDSDQVETETISLVWPKTYNDDGDLISAATATRKKHDPELTLTGPRTAYEYITLEEPN